MPFGSADRAQLQRITDQLGRMSTDLAALKQQVADQQHTIDQIRQDATAAINTGLAEIRSVAREAMARTTDLVTGPLSRISTEIVGLRGAVEQIDGRLSAAPAPEPEPETASRQDAPQLAAGGEPPNPPTGEVTPSPEPEPGSDAAGPDPAVLRAAAGVAHATVEAHRDTWAFLVQVAGRAQHFHIPGEVRDDDGFVSVRFSGPSLVAAITSLSQITRTATNPVTQAIADHIQQKITNAVEEIITRPGSDGDGKPVRIVIDDRAAPVEADGAQERAAGSRHGT
ncbi:hypothetical protein [Streptomyces sp. NPDC052012]|uniref:hypothetical protein n=1 Tax=Streptomyces sp. NPDC052012 TaxID=3155051 RepID=UPI00344F5878